MKKLLITVILIMPLSVSFGATIDKITDHFIELIKHPYVCSIHNQPVGKSIINYEHISVIHRGKDKNDNAVTVLSYRKSNYGLFNESPKEIIKKMEDKGSTDRFIEVESREPAGETVFINIKNISSIRESSRGGEKFTEIGVLGDNYARYFGNHHDGNLVIEVNITVDDVFSLMGVDDFLELESLGEFNYDIGKYDIGKLLIRIDRIMFVRSGGYTTINAGNDNIHITKESYDILIDKVDFMSTSSSVNSIRPVITKVNVGYISSIRFYGGRLGRPGYVLMALQTSPLSTWSFIISNTLEEVVEKLKEFSPDTHNEFVKITDNFWGRARDIGLIRYSVGRVANYLSVRFLYSIVDYEVEGDELDFLRKEIESKGVRFLDVVPYKPPFGNFSLFNANNVTELTRFARTDSSCNIRPSYSKFTNILGSNLFYNFMKTPEEIMNIIRNMDFN